MVYHNLIPSNIEIKKGLVLKANNFTNTFSSSMNYF
jgi:hypothetical protein